MAEFFSMGGHGLYIWAGYGVSIFALSALIIYRRAEIKNIQKLKQSSNQ